MSVLHEYTPEGYARQAARSWAATFDERLNLAQFAVDLYRELCEADAPQLVRAHANHDASMDAQDAIETWIWEQIEANDNLERFAPRTSVELHAVVMHMLIRAAWPRNFEVRPLGQPLNLMTERSVTA
jgi:hypothetical protein